MSDKSSPKPGLVILAFLAVYIIWGSTYFGIRVAIETIPPFLMAGMRFVIAGSLLYAFGMQRGWQKPTRLHWRNSAIIGGLMLLGGNGLVTWSEQYLASGLAAVLVATVPLWIVLLSALRKREYPARQIMAGLLLGFGGVVVLVGPANVISGDSEISLIGVGAIMIATFSWAIGSLFSRTAEMPKEGLMPVSMEMLCGGSLMVLFGVLVGDLKGFEISEISGRSLAAMLYLTTFGSMVAFSAYIWLLKVTTPARAATYAYVNPVIAILLGWAFANEELNATILIASAMIIGAVVMITTYKSQRPTSVIRMNQKPASSTVIQDAQ